MTNTTSLPPYQPSLFAIVRVQADAILRGPQSMRWDPEIEGEPLFYGWPVLSLEVMAAQTDYVEARSVYANPLDDAQQSVILRAVAWDGESARRAVREQGQNFKLNMPARFVKLPAERLKTWLSEFDGVNVAVNQALGDDDTINIKRLRIERDYKSCVFEKIWQAQDEDRAILNRKWDEVWMQMREALVTESLVADLRENFRLVQLEITYDFQIYQPDWFILK